MIKKSIWILLVSVMMTAGVQAVDKQLSYDIINQCKYTIDETGRNNISLEGVLVGMAQAYIYILGKSGIDNEYAGLITHDYSVQMCQYALDFRKNKNKETGGKYDVTNFYYDLQAMGYIMTLPPKMDTNTTNK